MAGKEIKADPILAAIIEDIRDRKRMSAGIEACRERMSDFSSELEMALAGIAMVPEARNLVTERLSEHWEARTIRSIGPIDTSKREIIAGGGFHAAVYAANRMRMGFPKPIVLERSPQPGGAFAVSMRPVFRLNSRSRPGKVGLPDQDKALNDIPGGLVQPSMISSEEYPDNTIMAWLIWLTLTQFADVYPNAGVTGVSTTGAGSSSLPRVSSTEGEITCGRFLDARGTGDETGKPATPSPNVLTFRQLMKRMSGMFPLRGMRQIAIIGGGNSGLCAAESLLGIAPGNTSAIGLDYVERVDLYAVTVDGRSCAEFRTGARGRYIRLAQFLTGNVSQPVDRLNLMGVNGYVTPLPDGVIVNDRSYDMAVLCTGSELKPLDTRYTYSDVRANQAATSSTVLAKQASPLQLYKIGPAADISFSEAEVEAGIAENPANKVAMFRLANRTAGLATMLPGLT